MEQIPLLINSLSEALHNAGSRCGGYKALCCAICPEHKEDPEEAQKVVARKLSKSCNEVFSDLDMDRAIRHETKHGSHILKWFKDDLHGYEPSVPKPAKSALISALERQSRLSSELAEVYAEIEILQSDGEAETVSRLRRLNT